MKHVTALFATENHFGGPALRMAIGGVILPHGCQLLLGWFGGFGFDGTMQYLTENEGLPWLVSFMVIALQFFGSIALLLGFATRLISLGFIIMFIGMIVTSHLEYGFFMNWMGNQAGEGYEYHLLVIGLAAGLCLNGAGSYSLDRFLSLKWQGLEKGHLKYAL